MDVVGIVLAALLSPVPLVLSGLVVVGCVPAVVRIRGAYGRRPRAHVQVRWAEGVVVVDYREPSRRVEVRLFGRRVYADRVARPRPSPIRVRPQGGRRTPAQWVSGLAGLRWAVRYLWRAWRVRTKVRCVVGGDDPADTAMLAGGLCLLAGLVPVPVGVTADFAAAGTVLEGWVRARLVLVSLVWVVLGLLGSTSTRRLIRGH